MSICFYSILHGLRADSGSEFTNIQSLLSVVRSPWANDLWYRQIIFSCGIIISTQIYMVTVEQKRDQ